MNNLFFDTLDRSKLFFSCSENHSVSEVESKAGNVFSMVMKEEENRMV